MLPNQGLRVRHPPSVNGISFAYSPTGGGAPLLHAESNPDTSPTPSAPDWGPSKPTTGISSFKAAAAAGAIPFALCQLAEPCGAGFDSAVIGAALITAAAYAAKLTYNHFSSEQSLIRQIAREYGISATALGNAIHAWKQQHGMGGADNLTADQIREIASEVQQGLWKGTE